MSSNICNCPDPPGGQVACEPNQMAVCIVKNGRARTQCLDPIDSDRSSAIVNWSLTEITGIARSQDETITEDDIKILFSQMYFEYETMVTFILPMSIKKAVREFFESDLILTSIGGMILLTEKIHNSDNAIVNGVIVPYSSDKFAQKPENISYYLFSLSGEFIDSSDSLELDRYDLNEINILNKYEIESSIRENDFQVLAERIHQKKFGDNLRDDNFLFNY